MASNMFDVKQLAEYLNVSISLIRKLVKNKDIPYVRLGVKILFSALTALPDGPVRVAVSPSEPLYSALK